MRYPDSLEGLLKDVLVEREVGDKFLEAGVLFFEFLEALELVPAHAAILAFPAVVGLLGDVDVLDGFGDGLPLGGEGFDLAELGDDLLGSVIFFLHRAAWFGAQH